MQFPVATILACLFALIASVVGQSVVILSPKDNDSIALNQTFTVQVGVPVRAKILRLKRAGHVF